MRNWQQFLAIVVMCVSSFVLGRVLEQAWALREKARARREQRAKVRAKGKAKG